MKFLFRIGGSKFLYSVLISEKEAYGTVPKSLNSVLHKCIRKYLPIRTIFSCNALQIFPSPALVFIFHTEFYIAASIPEIMIEPILINGLQGRTDDVAKIVSRIAERYAGDILKRLVDYGYKENLVHLYVIGGGGCLLKYYSDIASKGNVTVLSRSCPSRTATNASESAFP